MQQIKAFERRAAMGNKLSKVGKSYPAVVNRETDGGGWGPFDRLHSEIDRALGRVFGADFGSRWGLTPGTAGEDGAWAWNGEAMALVPPVDVTETDGEVSVEAEIPGIEPKHIEVSIDGDVLTIRGEKSESSEKREGECYMTERRFGRFLRRVHLPSSVNGDKATAEFKNGVLMFRAPKVSPSSRKTIPVSVSK